MVIIVEVKLKQVSSTQLKRDPTGHPLWFNNLDQDVYLIVGEDEVRHFEISFGNSFFSGGASKALQYGLINEDSGKIGQGLARIVQYHKEIPQDQVNKAINLVKSCDGLEDPIIKGLAKYLSGFSFGTNQLRFDTPLECYLPIEDRKSFKIKTKVRRYIKSMNLPKHLGLKSMAALFVFGAIFFYFSAIETKKELFLDMDKRMNISYIKKYSKSGGDLTATDDYGKNILHRIAPYIWSIKDEQFKAFTYLVQEKGLNPNLFDINGKTPLYYMVSNHLSPPEWVLEAVIRTNGINEPAMDKHLESHLVAIKELLKLGIKPKIKLSDEYDSAWDLGKQDYELRNILQ